MFHLMEWRRGEIERLKKEMDDLLDHMMSRLSEVGSFCLFPPPPTADLSEMEDKIVVSLDLPDVDINDLEAILEGDVLTITGRRIAECDIEEQPGEGRQSMRSYGVFIRRVPIPAKVLSEGVSAEYKDGRLRVTLPKLISGIPKKIRIEHP
ncbi:MAG: Hsp20/alpha crystallin family protein [Deltaproteobacteria bacterium]|nr:Hsp20/alpha crystallin family protein [Deltaproteobacteria bacterium]